LRWQLFAVIVTIQLAATIKLIKKNDLFYSKECILYFNSKFSKMPHNIITLFFVGVLVLGEAEAAWVTERQCENQSNNTFGIGNARNGNCIPAYDPKDGYVYMSCSNTNFTTYVCQDEGCSYCKVLDTRPLNQCTDDKWEGRGRFLYQCFPDKIDFEKVIDSQSYLLQTFYRGNQNNEPCKTPPTQIFINPVDKCFTKREKDERGFYITCNSVSAEFREYDDNTCTETPIRTYHNDLRTCYNVANELGEVISCVTRK
jgi:hypothetical protein